MTENGGSKRKLSISASGKTDRRFVIRFHLHPAVRASLVQEGNSVLLRLAGGDGWRFRASGGAIGLQESVYLGVRDAVKRCEQIVIAAATENGEGQVKWAFSRLAGDD